MGVDITAWTAADWMQAVAEVCDATKQNTELFQAFGFSCATWSLQDWNIQASRRIKSLHGQEQIHLEATHSDGLRVVATVDVKTHTRDALRMAWNALSQGVRALL